MSSLSSYSYCDSETEEQRKSQSYSSQESNTEGDQPAALLRQEVYDYNNLMRFLAHQQEHDTLRMALINPHTPNWPIHPSRLEPCSEEQQFDRAKLTHILSVMLQVQSIPGLIFQNT